MPAKLEHMCPSYELWDQWFGSKQKYNPSNVQTNAREDLELSSVDEADDEEGQARGMDLAQTNDTDGGRDAMLDADAANGGGEGEGEGEGEGRAASSMRPTNPPQSPRAQSSPLGQPSPRPPVARQPPQRQPPQRQQQQQAAAAAAASAAAVNAAVSTSPSTAAKADKFDATYSAVQHKKIEMMQHVEQSRCANAIEMQMRDHMFQAKLVGLQQQCKDEDAQAERRLRQRISYETNLAQVLQKDTSGQLADDFDRRIQRQLSLEATREHSQGSNASQLLAALLQGLHAPRQ